MAFLVPPTRTTITGSSGKRNAANSLPPFAIQTRQTQMQMDRAQPGAQRELAHLLVHGLALGLHVGVGIEVVGLEDLELVGELHPAVAAARAGSATASPHRGPAHREHPGMAGRPRPRRLGRRHIRDPEALLPRGNAGFGLAERARGRLSRDRRRPGCRRRWGAVG